MVEQKIEFRKTRDFGENLNDTFLFIRLNFGPLVKSFFAICAVFILSQAVFTGIYQSRFGSIFQSIFTGGRVNTNYAGRVFNATYFILLLLMLCSFVAVQVALGAYIKYYVENDGKKAGIEEVWSIFKKYYFRVFFYSIPIMLSVFIGTIFCIVPGVYLWVVFVPYSMVTMIEDTSFTDTYYRCFDLIRDNFWMSLGLYLVVYLIYYICAAITGLTVSGIVGVITYLSTKNAGTTYGLVISLLKVFSFCFDIIFIVSAALNYFNLVERKDGLGILNRINNIGDKKNDFDNIEEQY